MSSIITRTITTSQDETRVFLELNNKVQPLIDSLAEILDEFLEEEDHLSKRLLDWGYPIVMVDQNPDMDLATFQGQMEGRLNTLEKKILVNPFAPSTLLKEPVMERTWLWEKATLDDYLSSSKVSPYDKKPIEETKPHVFATRMIEWLHLIRQTTQTMPEEAQTATLVQLGSQSPNPQDRALVRALVSLLYTKSAENIKMGRTLQSFTRELNSRERSLVNLKEEIIEGMEKARVEMEQRMKENERVITERINTLGEIHSAEVTLLNSRMSNVQVTLTQTQGQLSQVEAINVRNGAELRLGWASNADMRRQLQEIRNRDGGWCVIL